MERAECIARAERELDKARRTLEHGERHGAPQKDLWHMLRTVEYREAVVEALVGVSKMENPTDHFRDPTKMIEGDTYDMDRLRELVEADREGRCVVLPVKPHYRLYSTDAIYVIEDGEIFMDFVVGIEIGESTTDAGKMCVLYESGDGDIFEEGDWGKRVFLSYEEAEQALKGGKDG